MLGCSRDGDGDSEAPGVGGGDLDADLVFKAEAHLVGAARDHDAKTLRILGRRLLEVVAPEVADAHEARLLVREEADAALACRLTLHDNGKGRCEGSFTIPSFHGAALEKMLLAFTEPRKVQGPARMGRAFCVLIERYPAESPSSHLPVQAARLDRGDLRGSLGSR